MKIEKVKWLNNTDSPVIFMVDDLANVWIDTNSNGKIDLGEDWGFARDGKNSSYKYLKDNILNDFPEVKTTFFVPLDRKPILENHKYNSHFGPINETEELKKFFYNIHNKTKDEIAYHGITHGISGNENHPFIQEWLMYKNLNEAVETITIGRDFFKNVFGEYPTGGKYCGYARNDFSDESIDKSGFTWWCRFWNRTLDNIPDSERFEIKYFGNNNVIDIPSTIAGNLFNIPKTNFVKQSIKKLLEREIISEAKIEDDGFSQLSKLLDLKQVISIQEHISPARTDGKRQTLNIFDDEHSLKKIFTFLKKQNVWYATCTEVAEYFEVFNNTEIEIIGSDTFNIKYSGKAVKNKFLTLSIETDYNKFLILTPHGEKIQPTNISSNNKLLVPKLPISNGNYKLIDIS